MNNHDKNQCVRTQAIAYDDSIFEYFKLYNLSNKRELMKSNIAKIQ